MQLRKYIIAALVLGLGLSSCSNFEDLNTDPTTSTKAHPQSLVTAVASRYSGDREVTWRSTAGYHMPFIQMISDGWTISRGQVYEQDPSYIEYFWRSSYRNINDLQAAINASYQNKNLSNYRASAKVLRALIFSQLTDTYGDVPYFEAVRGYDDDILHPTYDTQEEIYMDLFKELKSVDTIFSSEYEFNGDLIYGGNVEQWKQFAHSLRLRFAMRLIHVPGSIAKDEAEAAVAAGLFSSYTDGAILMHDSKNVSTGGDLEIRGNGFSQVQNFSEEIMVGCETYVAYMRDNNDPRFNLMWGMYGAYVEDASSNVNFKSTTVTSVEVTEEYLNSQGKLIGYPPGKFLWDTTDNEGISWTEHFVEKNGRTVQINKYFKSVQLRRELTRLDMPTIYQPYSEVLLWLAEMDTYGWDNKGAGTAQVLHGEAVKASLAELQYVYKADSDILPGADVDTYITTTWAAASSPFEAINMQHYVNNFFNGMEGFTNWRRSGIPLLKTPKGQSKTDPALNGLIPRRLSYPNSEMNYNRSNLESHLDNGSNFWGAPVWWDGDINRGVDLTP